ncbi:carbon-nitrogen hydrolase family protein [Rhizobium tumorigenes]|uniref:carbon-nitrogen hydrolase family protein n=1 Tax=Rhizobium tumorigenes TaxID=2041385 RepID=UPI00241C38DB|nr:carbon-nitrogen hydrolase family protein [Rhizobium tumorigenes]WFS02603.1 carbon-nitrogen hydrolase family protein [Rhizobium tumorigenes]
MRIATFQRFPVFDDIEAAADVIGRDLVVAHQKGVDLAVFPETFLQGHSYDGEVVERRAIEIDNFRLAALLHRLPSVRTAAIIGFFERRQGVVHNSALLVEAGRVTGVYAKVNPFEKGCTPGREFPVWRRHGWTFGINICSDLRLPSASAALAAQGARLICCPLNMMLKADKAPRWREPALEALRQCARINDSWVVSADVTGKNADGWISFGCTAIVRPDGTVVAQAPEGAEGMLVFDLA